MQPSIMNTHTHTHTHTHTRMHTHKHTHTQTHTHRHTHTHTPDKLLEIDNVKILWDFSVETDRKLEKNESDILIVDKQKGECYIIYVACPFDTRVKEKEQEKVERYHKLKREIGRLWQCKKW